MSIFLPICAASAPPRGKPTSSLAPAPTTKSVLRRNIRSLRRVILSLRRDSLFVQGAKRNGLSKTGIRFPHVRLTSSRLQLPCLAKIRVDPCLPAVAGLAIGGEHVGIEPKLYGLLRVSQRRPAATNDL